MCSIYVLQSLTMQEVKWFYSLCKNINKEKITNIGPCGLLILLGYIFNFFFIFNFFCLYKNNKWSHAYRPTPMAHPTI